MSEQTQNQGTSGAEGELSDNPASRGMNVTLSVPETVQIRMVEATALADYEMLFFLSSLLGSAVVGFLIATLQAKDEQRTPYLSFTIVLAVLFVTFITWTLRKRYLLTKNSRTVAIPYVQAGSPKPKRRPTPRKSKTAPNPHSVPPPDPDTPATSAAPPPAPIDAKENVDESAPPESNESGPEST